MNQCDGCKRGLPLKDGIHKASEGYDMIGCTAERYQKTSEGPVVSCQKCANLESALREVVATYMILDDCMETQREVTAAVDVVLQRKWPSIFGS